MHEDANYYGYLLALHYANAYLYSTNKGKKNQKDKTMKTAKNTTAAGTSQERINTLYNDLKGFTYNAKGEKVRVTIPAREEEVSDDENPAFLFSTTFTSLLSRIAKGEIDANYIARAELANRGLDLNGNWVGVQQAKRIHRMPI